MSHVMVSAGSLPSFLNCSNPISPASKSIIRPFSDLSFNTHLPKPGFPLKTRSGSYRTRPMAAINSLCMTTESFYDLLGISEGGTLTDIKQAYKQLVRKYHPDVSPPDRTEENTKRFIQVREAYETLSDPQSRALYDRDLDRGLYMAFSARTKFQEKRMDESGEWRNQWQSQLRELKRRMMNNDSRKNMSWGARMRCQRSKAPAT